MSKRIRARIAAVLVASSLTLMGCIKESDDVTVKSDGSGTYSESMVMDLSGFKAMTDDLTKGIDAAAAADGAKPATDEPKDDPLAELKAQWKGLDGLEVTKAVSEEQADGKVTMAVEAKFTSLEVYAKATSVEMSASLKKNDDGSYTLRFFDEEAAGAGPGAAPGGDAAAAAFMPMLEGFMKDLEIKRALKLPGKIVETNGKKGEDDSTVTWTITWEELKKSGTAMPAQTVTFKADGLNLKPFTVKREKKDPTSALGGGIR